MRHSIRLWLDWAMSDLLHLNRPRAVDQSVYTRYEKAGLTLYGPTLPWNADAVVVELIARLPPAARTRTDFTLRLPGQTPVTADTLRKDEVDASKYRVFFRLAVPQVSAAAELLWRNRLLATAPLTVYQADQYLSELKLTTPTVAVRVGSQSVAAQTFVTTQCRGLTAAAVLRSPAGLAPLADLGVRAVFKSDRGSDQIVPVPLTSSQLSAKEALLTAAPAKAPRRAGIYSVTWCAGSRELFTQPFVAVTGPRFLKSLRVSDARFVTADKAGAVRSSRNSPQPGEAVRVGPYFVLASSEPGAAGVLTLQVVAVVPGGKPPLVLEQTVLVTDGPTVFAPGLLDVSELGAYTGFELRHREKVLGVLSVSPVPTAVFNSEGAFKPPPDFAWTQPAEDELAERLAKLMGDGG